MRQRQQQLASVQGLHGDDSASLLGERLGHRMRSASQLDANDTIAHTQRIAQEQDNHPSMALESEPVTETVQSVGVMRMVDRQPGEWICQWLS